MIAYFSAIIEAMCPLFDRFLLTLVILTFISSCSPDLKEDTAPETLPSAVNTAFQPVIGTRGGMRVIGNLALPNTFNPYLTSESASLAVIYRMFSGLTRLNAATRQIEPDLAASWQISADQRVYTIRLRPGLKWSDGMPLTAADVLFTYQQVINHPGIPNNYRDFWSDQGVFPQLKQLDPLTIRFTLQRPFAPTLYNLSAPIIPRHIFAQAVYPDAEGQIPFNRLWGLNTPVEQIVVNGPWKLARYVPGQRLELVPNPYYYEKDARGQPLPYLERLIFLDLQDANTALLKFRQGETDTYDLRPEDYELLKDEQKSGRFTIYNLGTTPSSLLIMFNQSKARHPDGRPLIDPIKTAWFRTLKFRQALSHTIDKQGLIESIYRGRAIPQISHLNAHNPFYHPRLPDYGYDPARARALLKAAGFHWSSTGELLDPQGHRVEFELTTNAANPERHAICAILRREWQNLGIKVNYRPRTMSALVNQIHHTLDWEVMLIGLAGSSFEPHFSSSRWMRHGRMHLFNLGHPSRWKGYPTVYEPWEVEMEKLYAQAAVTLDFEQRKALYWRAQELERQHLPFLYTVSEMSLLAVRNHLGNVFPSIFGGSGLNQVNWNSQYHFLRSG